ncbi:hypothetical protein DOTSEDRAFT_46216 [Dothistroma septosporum NZE10]|uniref:Uncharacterized protein n=1 Tax=Dothistroma septosporum (strain NZE10 / CBS 128990) TaxID=675120 RepID=N1PIL2_DOTSN|nr:hypothetical protein DOTSEDRAFT_46216 [Dothistroma septosporum NZE10]
MAKVISFDYEFSPVGQKTKLVLKAAGIPFERCDQPAMLPRPSLEALDITYRRIPLLAIGKDIYCDSELIIKAALSELGKLPTSLADKAFKEWGDNVFSDVCLLIPAEVLSEDFNKDRSAINFMSIQRPDLKSARPSSIAQFRGRLKQIEEQFFLSGGPFINGANISLADIEAVWPVRWAFKYLGLDKEAGLGKDKFPRTWKWIESMPDLSAPELSADDTHTAIRSAQYTAKDIGIAKDDPTGLQAGTKVNVESFDTKPGAYPQAGKLVGLNDEEIVVEVKDGVRLHFPRVGYIVRDASAVVD